MTRLVTFLSTVILLSGTTAKVAGKIRMDEDHSVLVRDQTTGRHLQLDEDSAVCYSTQDDRRPNRYCSFDDTPREETFLQLSCPDSKGEDLSQCYCTIGVGEPEQAPDTETCDLCTFCSDGSLAYDCRNVAEGSCIGRNCAGGCIGDTEEPGNLSMAESRRVGLFAGIVALLVGILV